MPGADQRLDLAGATNGDFALAILDRIAGVAWPQAHFASAFGARDRAEMGFDQGQGIFGIKIAGDDDDGIVGLVITSIEGLQTLDRHVLDIRACSDGRSTIAVPQIGGGHDPLQ